MVHRHSICIGGGAKPIFQGNDLGRGYLALGGKGSLIQGEQLR